MKVKILLSTLFTVYSVNNLNAIEYSTTIEPYQKYEQKADVSGKVLFSDFNKENKTFKKDTVIVRIDDTQNKIQLTALLKQEQLLKHSILLETSILKSIKKSRNKSILEKNKEELNLISMQQNLTDIEKNILDLQDIMYRKKVVVPKNMYLNKVYVTTNSFVNNNSLLFDYYDISKQKIIVFVRDEDIKNIDKKNIFINGKEFNNFKINKKSIIKDSTHLGTYKIELISNNKNKFNFGDVVKVDFQ